MLRVVNEFVDMDTYKKAPCANKAGRLAIYPTTLYSIARAIDKGKSEGGKSGRVSSNRLYHFIARIDNEKHPDRQKTIRKS